MNAGGILTTCPKHAQSSDKKPDHRRGSLLLTVSRFAAAHEECERLDRIIVKDFDQDLKGHREKLAQGHRVRRRLDELQALSTKLVRELCSTL